MAARSLILAFTLGAFAVACGHSQARGPSDVATTPVPPPPAADPPPAIPPPAVVQQAQENAASAEPVITPAPATPVAAGDDLQPTDENQNAAQIQEEARANAQAAAKEKAKWAKLAVQQDRKQTEEWSRDRAMKAGARASTLQSQVSRVPAPKKGKFNTDMTNFVTKKNAVLSRVNSLSATGSEEWKTAKAELDRAIDEMDTALMRLEGDF